AGHESRRALRSAAKARLNTPEPIDWRHVAEEIEDIGAKQADRLEWAYRIVLLHLLKWHYQTRRQTRSWRLWITEHRLRIAKQLRRNPGLKPSCQQLMEEDRKS